MKTVIAVAFIALAVLLSVAPANAQVAATHVIAPYADFGVSASSTFTGTDGLTASNPNYNAGIGIESDTRHLLLDANGQFYTGNVRTFSNFSKASFKGTINVSGYAKLGFLLVGGGARYSDQVVSGQVSALIPSSINELVPYVGGGAQFSRDRFTIVYVLPGRSTSLNSREFDFHNELYLTKGGHFRLTADVVGVTGDTGLPIRGLQGTRISGGSAGAGIKVVL